MTIGAFLLNTLSAASGGGSDAPIIPAIDFNLLNSYTNSSSFAPYGAVNKSLTYSYNFNFPTMAKSSTTGVYTAGYSATGFYPGTIATGTSGQNYAAVSSPRGASAAQFIGFIGSPSNVRYRTGVFSGASAASAGTIGASQARTSNLLRSVGAAHSPLTSSLTTHRPLLVYHTVVSSVNYIAIAVGSQSSGSTSITLSISLPSSTSIDSSSTASFGANIDACGFTSATSAVYKYAVGYQGSGTTYKLTAFKTNLTNVYKTSVTMYSGSNVYYGSVDSIWDDQPNNKYVAVSCVNLNDASIILRSAKITWGSTETDTSAPTVTLGTELSLGPVGYNAHIHRTGRNGLGILVYQSTIDSSFNARFISVDSTTGDITIGSQMSLASSSGNFFGVGAGLDSSNYLCLGTLEGALTSNNARLFKSSAPI